MPIIGIFHSLQCNMNDIPYGSSQLCFTQERKHANLRSIILNIDGATNHDRLKNSSV